MLVRFTDEAVDFPLVLLEIRVDVSLIEVDGALLAWQDEVEVDSKSDP